MTSRRQFLGQASGLAALGTLGTAGILAPASAWADDKWPSRPIRLVVPYPAGGSSDIIARLISKQLGEALGQPIVVDNRPGANGNIGAAMVAHLASWRQSTMFSGSEALALAYCEALTRYEHEHFDEMHQGLTVFFDEREIAEIAAVVINMNVWTRLKLAQGATPSLASKESP